MLKYIAVALAAFIIMEGVSYLAHRYVMHGAMWALHKSHHALRTGVFEANDAFPLMFSVPAGVLIAAGMVWPEAWVALSAGIGATLYGAAYTMVHDGYIHRRIPLPVRKLPGLESLRRAHLRHHATGGEPYGMLYVPRAIRRQAGA